MTIHNKIFMLELEWQLRVHCSDRFQEKKITRVTL